MRDRIRIIILLSLVLLLPISTVYAVENIDVIDSLDWSDVEKIFNELPVDFKAFFGGDIKQYISEFSKNNESFNFENFKILIMSNLTSSLKKHLSLFSIVLLIIIISSLFKSIKPDFASNSVSRIVDFSVAVIIGSILSYSILTFVKSVSNFVSTINSLIQVFFPLIFTILTTLGATVSTGSFQICASIFVNVLTSIIVGLVLPVAVLGIVFSIISTIKRNSSAKSISFSLVNFAKKSICIIFFIFSGVIALQGISVSVKDTVSVRIAKFSLNKYIPIIGGYLSEGFNYLYAGSVLLKNSIGVSFIILICVITLPVLIEVTTCHILLKISASVSGTMSENKLMEMFGGLSKCTSLLITSIICISVCLIIFVGIVILSCNSVL